MSLKMVLIWSTPDFQPVQSLEETFSCLADGYIRDMLNSVCMYVSDSLAFLNINIESWCLYSTKTTVLF